MNTTGEIKKTALRAAAVFTGITIWGTAAIIVLNKTNVITLPTANKSNVISADYDATVTALKPGKFYLYGDTSKQYYEITEDGYIQLKNADYEALATAGCTQRVLDILNGKETKGASKEEIDDVLRERDKWVDFYKKSYKIEYKKYHWDAVSEEAAEEFGYDWVTIQLTPSKQLLVFDENTLRKCGVDPVTGEELIYIRVD